MLNFNELIDNIHIPSEYQKRLHALKNKGFQTDNIEATVDESINNLKSGCSSFVIYGEPQCGKTELMIALSAQLIDIGKKIIIILLNDDTDLLNQNLRRFRSSGINPTPINYTDILEKNIGNKKWIIFCKKNSSDLFKLSNSLDRISDKIIIDDEGDYASPNGKVNKSERTKINELINDLLKSSGVYIGVTATPARLDLNNTFSNLTEKWVQFKPHDNYVGKEVFFPVNSKEKLKFSLNPLPESGDKPEFIRNAIASFIVNVSILRVIKKTDENYSFLIHTSGEVDEHSKDKKDVVSYFDALVERDNSKHEKYWKDILNIISTKLENEQQQTLVFKFAYSNISNHCASIINSKNKVNNIGLDTDSPAAIYTIFIGGNKVSRGITFGNLLGMFFTRDAQKIQQDTYIQRARMFGNRKKYLEYFELWITKSLYIDWRRCFMYHYLSLKSIETNGNAPVWIGDERIRPVANPSIDKSTLVLDKGEMVFSKFSYTADIEKIIQNANKTEILTQLLRLLGNASFPQYVFDFIFTNINNAQQDINIIPPRLISDKDSDALYRKKGTFGGRDLKENSIHHIMITHNSKGEARLIYYYSGKVQFFGKISRS